MKILNLFLAFLLISGVGFATGPVPVPGPSPVPNEEPKDPKKPGEEAPADDEEEFKDNGPKLPYGPLPRPTPGNLTPGIGALKSKYEGEFEELKKEQKSNGSIKALRKEEGELKAKIEKSDAEIKAIKEKMDVDKEEAAAIDALFSGPNGALVPQKFNLFKANTNPLFQKLKGKNNRGREVGVKDWNAYKFHILVNQLPDNQIVPSLKTRSDDLKEDIKESEDKIKKLSDEKTPLEKKLNGDSATNTLGIAEKVQLAKDLRTRIEQKSAAIEILSVLSADQNSELHQKPIRNIVKSDVKQEYKANLKKVEDILNQLGTKKKLSAPLLSERDKANVADLETAKEIINSLKDPAIGLAANNINNISFPNTTEGKAEFLLYFISDGGKLLPGKTHIDALGGPAKTGQQIAAAKWIRFEGYKNYQANVAKLKAELLNLLNSAETDEATLTAAQKSWQDSDPLNAIAGVIKTHIPNKDERKDIVKKLLPKALDADLKTAIEALA